jgi:hypothetical protein
MAPGGVKPRPKKTVVADQQTTRTFLCQLQLHPFLVPGKMKKMLATLMTTYSPLFKASSTTMLVTNFMFALTG